MQEKLNKVVYGEKELANALGVAYNTIKLWRQRDGLPFFRTGGKIYYQYASVQKWMNKQEQQSMQEEAKVW